MVSASSRPTGTTRGVCGHELDDGPPSLRVLRGRDDAGRLVQQDVRERLRGDALPVDLDDIPRSDDGVELAALAVHHHAACRDQLVRPPPRRDARPGEERIQPHAPILAARGFRSAPTRYADARRESDRIVDGQAGRARRLRRERPGGSARRRHELRRQGGRRAENRSRRLRARRQVRRRGDLRPMGQAGADRPRRRGHARLRATVDVAATPAPFRRARRADHALGPARAAGAGGSRSCARRQGSAPVPARDGRGRQPADDQLDDRPGADARLGHARVPGPRSRRGVGPALGSGRSRLPPRCRGSGSKHGSNGRRP